MRQSCLNRQPAIVDLNNGRFQFIYNQQKVEKTNPERGVELSWEYDYIDVPTCEEDIIIASLIHEQYSLDDEIALINNFNIAAQGAAQEYDVYNSVRMDIKLLVRSTLNETI